MTTCACRHFQDLIPPPPLFLKQEFRYIFGGHEGKRTLNDLWEFNLGILLLLFLCSSSSLTSSFCFPLGERNVSHTTTETFSFVQVQPTGVVPTARCYHTASLYKVFDLLPGSTAALPF
jgi:hypothetical protein